MTGGFDLPSSVAAISQSARHPACRTCSHHTPCQCRQRLTEHRSSLVCRQRGTPRGSKHAAASPPRAVSDVSTPHLIA
eukprot:146023-Rhodomonas_salina.1